MCLYGDGATIVRSPLINILASSPDNPQCVLDVVDCTDHCPKGKKKDAHFIAQTALKCMKQVDREKELFDLVIFDGASNMQKGAELIAQHFPRVSTAVGTEHVVSNYIGKIVLLSPAKQLCKIAKKVVVVFYCHSFYFKTQHNYVIFSFSH